jgi:hypothetical protein
MRVPRPTNPRPAATVQVGTAKFGKALKLVALRMPTRVWHSILRRPGEWFQLTIYPSGRMRLSSDPPWRLLGSKAEGSTAALCTHNVAHTLRRHKCDKCCKRDDFPSQALQRKGD